MPELACVLVSVLMDFHSLFTQENCEFNAFLGKDPPERKLERFASEAPHIKQGSGGDEPTCLRSWTGGRVATQAGGTGG